MSFPELPPQGDTPRNIAKVVNQAMRGKINAVLSLTLTPNAGSTVLTDTRLTNASAYSLGALSANAAAALATTYPSTRGNGSWTFAHANNAQTDRVFTVTVIG